MTMTKTTEKLHRVCPTCRVSDPKAGAGCNDSFHSKVKACPECFVLSLLGCWHPETGDLETRAMDAEVRKEKRIEYLKWEIEEAEEKLERDVEEYLRLKYGQTTKV
jgi:hypothetical protein